MTLDVAYKKNKVTRKKECWAISRYCTPADIMKHCNRTMDRLEQECYGKTFKGNKRIIIRECRDIKTHGYVNSNAV